MRGQVLGSYRIIDILGKGGMGTVYLAEHRLLGRKAAIKTLHPALGHEDSMVRRFFNEARAATAIRHPGIVEVYDFGFRDDGTAYITMEYLEGQTLKARLHRAGQRGHLSSQRALEIARQMAGALSAAHEAGIIHRDLKPDNIFLEPDPEIGERVKILDFGIAKLVQRDPQDDGSDRTRTGTIMGTPTYMSPEQCHGAGRVDARTDLYSLGCVLFEMLCGQPPFACKGVGAVVGAHIYRPPPAPSSLAPSVTREVEHLVLRLLAKDPEQRFATAAELLAALERIRAGRGSAPPGYSRPPEIPQITAPPASPGMSGRSAATTLSEAAAQPVRSHRPSSTRRWVAAGAALVLAGMAGAGMLAPDGESQGQDAAAKGAASQPDAPPPPQLDAPPSPPRPQASPPPPQPQASPPPPQPQEPDEPPLPALTPDTPPTAPPEPRPETVRLTITSDPAGATVSLRGTDRALGRVLGRTPYDHETRRSDTQLMFEVRHPGYRAGRLELTASRSGTGHVSLDAEPPRSSARKESARQRAKQGKRTRHGKPATTQNRGLGRPPVEADDSQPAPRDTTYNPFAKPEDDR